MRSPAILIAILFSTAWVALASAGAPAEPTVQEIVFRADWDGRDEKYLLVVPANFQPEEPHDLLLALHGHGSDRRQFVEQPRDECRAARDTAAKHNLIFISPDYRAPTSWMGPAAEADVKQIIAEVKRKFAVRRVIISGGSMGGTSSLAFAALHPELVDGVVAMNGTANLIEYENFQEAIRKSYGGTKQEVPEEYRRRSAEFWPERLTMPIACTTGGQDRAVPPESVERLMTALKKLGRPVLHLHRVAGGHSTNYADAIEAYEFVVQRASRTDK
jgi:dipeptidyl aminopeptidase/acylaminoacyl peptidase